MVEVICPGDLSTTTHPRRASIRQHRGMRIINGCLTIASVLVGLVIGGYVVVNLFHETRAGLLRDRLSDTMTDRLADEVPRARERQGSMVVRTGRAPDHAWIEQSCQRGSNDAGWMVQSYTEVCELKSGAVWRVDSGEEAASLARIRVPESGGVPECERIGETPEGMEARLVTVGVEQPYCVSDSFPAKRAIDGERPSLPQGTWLLVEEEIPLLDEAIGCVRWTVLFCGDPWGGDHAFGEIPE